VHSSNENKAPMVPIEDNEVFESICLVPGPAIKIAQIAAFKTFFVDGAHMKDAKGETSHDNAQLLTVILKSSVVEITPLKKDIITKNVPLAMTLCLSESKDEYAFTFWSIELAGFSLNRSDVTICHDRGKAVIQARKVILHDAFSFFCNVHLLKNVQEIKEVGKLDDETASYFYAMTTALTPGKFNTARASLCERLPDAGKKYIMELEPFLINAYHYSQESGNAASFYNNNPAEQENQRNMLARWMKHPLDAMIEILKTWADTISSQQELVLGESVDALQPIFPATRERAFRAEKLVVASKFDAKVNDKANNVVLIYENKSQNIYLNVKLNERQCDCGKFQERGYPCVHALSASRLLDLKGDQIWNLFSEHHHMKNIREAYGKSIIVPSRTLFETDAIGFKSTIHFEQVPLEPGRPSKHKRKLSRGEKPQPTFKGAFGHIVVQKEASAASSNVL
jgi:hypothetical protein